MKAKLIFIEVEKSRLLRFADKSIMLHHEDSYRNRSGRQPIKPVLVGEGEIKEGDSCFFNFRGIISHKCMDVVVDKDHPYKVQHPERGKEVMYLPKSAPKLITQDTEELYEQIAKGELVEGVWYEFEENRCCGRCNDVDDLCVFDRICNEHKTEECITCWPSELSTPLKVVIESEEFPCYNRGTQNETEHGKCEKWCGNDNYCKQSHPEPNEVTEEECQELINEIDQFSRDYDPHGYALPIYKDNDNPNQDMIEIVKKWAIERMNKPPQDTTSQESKDYWKNYYNN